MRRRLAFLAAAVALLTGFLAGWLTAANRGSSRLERVVAFRWGDGKYGPAFYGMEVYLEPSPGGYSVLGRVHLGRGNDYFHDCGVLGQVATDAEAVQRFGTIEFRPDGLHVGDGHTDAWFLPRAELEAHR